MTDYAELHAHTAFSFLDGASQPEEMAAEAGRLGLSALAVTDHDGLYGIVRFAGAARAVGLPTVFGAELHLAVASPGASPSSTPRPGPPTPGPATSSSSREGRRATRDCPGRSGWATSRRGRRGPRATPSRVSPTAAAGSGPC